MSEELENSVREMLTQAAWTRATIGTYKNKNLEDLAELLKKAEAQDCEREIKAICDEQLARSKDSIAALYLSGMIELKSRSLDNSKLVSLVELFENNHKELLVEQLCTAMRNIDPTNRFALRKLAEFYKNENDNRMWPLYEEIVRVDLEEADIAKALAQRYEAQNSEKDKNAISYYKMALRRYSAAKNFTATKEMWSRLINIIIPEDIDFFLIQQKRIAKDMGADKSALLMQDVYKKCRELSNWDVSIEILKLILEIDDSDSWARKEIADCFRNKYASNSRVEDYIRQSSLTQSFRNVFEAIDDFEKHIAFSAGNYVFHRTWGVGRILKVEGDMLSIQFNEKVGKKPMSLKMAVTALQPLRKDHIWVLKATKRKDFLVNMVTAHPTDTLKIIIRSFDNNCDEKRIKAELVPSILTAGQWTSWHAKAKQILEKDETFDVNPDDVKFYRVRTQKLTKSARLANEFRAEKDFFSKIDTIVRYVKDDETDKEDDSFADMFNYFAQVIKSSNTATEEVVASYLVIDYISKNVTTFKNPATFTFKELYDNIDNPREMYTKLKDSRNTTLRQDYIRAIRLLEDWDTQYVRLFPTVLSGEMLDTLIGCGKKDKVVELVQNSFTEYRNNRDATNYFFENCRNQEWFKEANIPEEKQFVTLVNIISTCYKEINNHVNTTDNKKTIKKSETLLFTSKDNDKNPMLEYMLAHDQETITRLYTIVNDVKELDPKYKTQLRNGILTKYPEFKFQEAEVKQDAPKGLRVTARMLEVKKAQAEDIEKVQLPAVAVEVSEARAKGDLKENAEYTAAKEHQHYLNVTLGRLKEELARAVVFDPTTITTSMVSFGTTVSLHNNISGADETLTILGPWESDTEKGIISYLSPLGNSLLDMKVGQTKKFTINGHDYDYTVKALTAAKEL